MQVMEHFGYCESKAYNTVEGMLTDQVELRDLYDAVTAISALNPWFKLCVPLIC